MKISNTAKRLTQIMNMRELKQVDILKLAAPFCEKYNVKLNKNHLSQYVNGKTEPGQEKLYILGQALNVSEAWLMGFDVPMNDNEKTKSLVSPAVTDDIVTFPVIGEIAAGYDSIAVEDWTGETVDIPRAMLKGRKESEYFVLTVKGDSMYPHYQNNDKVLILKQSTLDHSGEVGAVLYEGECATLKKVEYKEGEDWLKLIPINPEFMPKLIKGSDLEQCRIIGKPTYLIRDLNNI